MAKYGLMQRPFQIRQRAENKTCRHSDPARKDIEENSLMVGRNWVTFDSTT